MTSHRLNNRFLLTAGLVLGIIALGVGAVAGPYVISPTGKMEGTKIKATKDGQIILTMKDGQVVTFPKGTKAVVEEPPDYGKALRMMEQRQYDEAVKLLTGVINDYRYLEWDRKAKKLLATVYVSKEDFKPAVAAFEELFSEAPELQKDGDAQIGYMRALMGAGNQEKLAPMLDEAIANGPRSAAALAQVLRGNTKYAAGDVEGALYDFMRTAELFKDVPDVQPEANFRTAECLGKLLDARAAEYYAVVVKEFPKSPYASRARARLGE